MRTLNAVTGFAIGLMIALLLAVATARADEPSVHVQYTPDAAALRVRIYAAAEAVCYRQNQLDNTNPEYIECVRATVAATYKTIPATVAKK